MVKTVKIDADVEAVLRAGSTGVRGTDIVFVLPAALDRALYVRVDKVLKALGARWDRWANGHVGPASFADALAEALSSGAAVDLKKTLGYFPTPPEIARRAAAALGVLRSDRILEPSAGGGALVEALLEEGGQEVHLTLVEIDSERCRELRERWPAATVHCGDFLTMPLPGFNKVLMNPPYDRTLWRDHVLHALTFLGGGSPAGSPSPASGGAALAAILPASAEGDERLTEALRARGFLYEIERLPEGAFKSAGTGVRTVLLSATLPQQAVQSTPMPGPANGDFLLSPEHDGSILLRRRDDSRWGPGFVFSTALGKTKALSVNLPAVQKYGWTLKGEVVDGTGWTWKNLVGGKKPEQGTVLVPKALDAFGIPWASGAQLWWQDSQGGSHLVGNLSPAVLQAVPAETKTKMDIDRAQKFATTALYARRLLIEGVSTYPGVGRAAGDRARFVAQATTWRAIAAGDLAGVLFRLYEGATSRGLVGVSGVAEAWIQGILDGAVSGLYGLEALRQDWTATAAAFAAAETTADADAVAWFKVIGIELRTAANAYARVVRRRTHAPAAADLTADAAAALADCPPASRAVLLRRLEVAEAALDDALRADRALTPQAAVDIVAEVVAEIRGCAGAPPAVAAVEPAPAVAAVVNPALRWTSAAAFYDLDTTRTVRTEAVEGYAPFRLVEVEPDRLSEQLAAYAVAEATAPGTVFVATEEEFRAWHAEAGLIEEPSPSPAPSPEAEAVVAASSAAEVAPVGVGAVGIYGVDATGTALYFDDTAISAVRAAGYAVQEDPGGAVGHEGRSVLWVGVEGTWYVLTPVDVFLDGGRGAIYRLDRFDDGDPAVVLTEWYGKGLVRPSDLQVVAAAEALPTAPPVDGEEPPPIPVILDVLAAAKGAWQANLNGIRAAVQGALGVSGDEDVLYEPDAVIGTWVSPEGAVRVVLSPTVSGGVGALAVRSSVSLTALGYDYTHEARIDPLKAGDPAVLFGTILRDAGVMLGTTKSDVATREAAQAAAQVDAQAAEIDPETGIRAGAAAAIEDFLPYVIEGAYAHGRAFAFVHPRAP